MPSPDNNPALHGYVPDTCQVALLLIDVLDSMEFDGAEAFAPRAQATAARIAQLKASAKRAGVPVIYVNDNQCGRWRSDVSGMLQQLRAQSSPGRAVIEQLRPEPDDYVVLKPKHSGFYATPLEVLLLYVRARRLVLTGFTTDQCVLFTASDAYMRDYTLFVPQDCTDSVDPDDTAPALRLMQRRLHVDTRPSESLEWAALQRS